MDYYRIKLKEKLDIISKSKGISIPDLDCDIFNDVSEGSYQIVWNYDQSRIIRLIKLDDKFTINNGKYLCKYPNGDFITLYSSQYINFSLKENREFKLNRILNIKKALYLLKN
jgi:hypothetical protein